MTNNQLPAFLQVTPVAAGVANLSEAARLLAKGMHLVPLVPFTKQPQGEAWNAPANRVTTIDPTATGYGLPLASNGLVSIDPDNVAHAAAGFAALGFDLEAIMQAGVRTRSTRPGSGGRSTFKAPAGVPLAWVKFASRTPGFGTILELRATSTNLQDTIPGLQFRDKEGNPCTQEYANEHRLDDPPELPPELLAWWQRCSTDLEFLRDQQAKFFAAIGVAPNLAISGTDSSGKITLAHRSPKHAQAYNAAHSVTDILTRHGYTEHRGGRWSCPTASGKPGIREIPGKDGLWMSSHASDALTGNFDAWIANVVLNHGGDLAAAQAAADREQAEVTAGMFGPVAVAAGASAGAGQVTAASKEHPWTVPVEPQLKPLAQRFVIDGLIQEGIVLIAGYRGVGKTVNLLSLYMAGVCGIGDPNSPLTAKRHRHLIWITEDPDQVWRVVRAIKAQGWATEETIRERLTVVAAVRITPDQVAGAVPFFKKHTVTHDMVTLSPAIVLDTKSSCFDLADENSNSENSAMVSACRDTGMNITLSTHTSKAISRSTDPSSMSARGAGSQEADSGQTLYLVEDGGVRYLLIGKKRFEMPGGVNEVAFDPITTIEYATDDWGVVKPQTLRCARARLTSTDQRTATAEATKADKIDKALVDAARQVHSAGGVVSRTKLAGLVEVGGTQTRLVRINSLIAGGFLETYVGELEQYDAAGIKADTMLVRPTGKGGIKF